MATTLLTAFKSFFFETPLFSLAFGSSVAAFYCLFLLYVFILFCFIYMPFNVQHFGLLCYRSKIDLIDIIATSVPAHSEVLL